MLTAARIRVTPEECLAIDGAADHKSEFVDGEKDTITNPILIVELPALACQLPLAEVYAKVEFA